MPERHRVSGVVVDAATGRPLLGLVVRAYDRDALADDFLGETHTDADGRFAIVFTEPQFRDWHETRPDLYVTVANERGQVIATTRDQTRRDAGPDERYVIEVRR